jgi:NTE family protein
MAFHLGCLRALHDRGILAKVRVISTVSGGSVIGASYAYGQRDFASFDKDMVRLLTRSIQRFIIREALFSAELPKILLTLILSGSASLVLSIAILLLAWLRGLLGIPTLPIERLLAKASRSFPIWGSLTTSFERALVRQLFGRRTLDDVAKVGVEVVINACDLRTGTAFRFGSKSSGGWRYGRITGQTPTVAKAVAASAAFPILLPPLVETFDFEKRGARRRETVILSDGGVFDNLGVSVLEPHRGEESMHAFPVTHMISLNAGPGQFDDEARPFWWVGRVTRSFDTVYRKAQDSVYSRLHRHVEVGELAGFGMVYLGQQDNRLPYVPPDLVPRDTVRGYPTDFAPISPDNLDLLTRRGEQLTSVIVDRYLPTLGI